MKPIAIFSKTMFICLFVLACSCDRDKFEDSPLPYPIVYKLRGDYIDNVCVGLTEDKSRIFVYPGPGDNCGDSTISPFEMIEGYYLDNCCNYGLNSAYLSIKKSEYKDIYPISKDSMYNLILDKDPYLEYYIDENYALDIKESPPDTPYFVFDTAFLNQIIRDKELDKHLTKLK